jgi:hypothetical protein
VNGVVKYGIDELILMVRTYKDHMLFVLNKHKILKTAIDSMVVLYFISSGDAHVALLHSKWVKD